MSANSGQAFNGQIPGTSTLSSFLTNSSQGSLNVPTKTNNSGNHKPSENLFNIYNQPALPSHLLSTNPTGSIPLQLLEQIHRQNMLQNAQNVHQLQQMMPSSASMLQSLSNGLGLPGGSALMSNNDSYNFNNNASDSTANTLKNQKKTNQNLVKKKANQTATPVISKGKRRRKKKEAYEEEDDEFEDENDFEN
jgi:hypothetical protein